MDNTSPEVLGFELYAESGRSCTWGDQRFSVIGHLHSPHEFLVGENTDDSSIWVISAELSEAWPLNANRTALEACLSAFARYIEDGPRDSAPLVLTAAEMHERLERRARGESVVRRPSRTVITHRKRLKRLRQDFEAADPSALTKSSWWAGTLEEAKHDLI